MIQIKNVKEAIHHACTQDQYGMDIIKETLQFPTNYHKQKKQLLHGEIDLLYLIPSSSTNIEYGYVGVVDSVSKMHDSSKLNPLWLTNGGSSNWDMLVTFKNLVKVSIENLENRGIQTKGNQGGFMLKK